MERKETMTPLGIRYIKHSKRQVRSKCLGCGTDKLYFAHEQHGNADTNSETWCKECNASGQLILVDMDTILPHSCTPSPESSGDSGEDGDGAGNPEPEAQAEPEPEVGEQLAAVAEGNDQETAQAQAEINAALEALAEGNDEESQEDKDNPQEPPFPDDDEYVTHKELNEFDPVSRAEAKESFDNVRDALDGMAKATIQHGGRIAEISSAMIELEKRTRTTIVINDVAANETFELPDELRHYQLEDVIRILSAEHCLMVGGAGAGKGEIAMQAAAALKLKFYTLDQGSLSPQTPVSSIIGYVNSSGKYIGTLFRKAFEFGGLIFLDELDNAHPACLATINAALALREGQELGFPGGKMVKRHKNFRVLAAANTFGRGPDRTYAARQRGDAATWDRFAILALKYDHTLEDVLCARTGVDQDTVVRVTRYVRALRANVEKHQGTIPVVIGMRASIGMCKLIKAGLDDETVIEARCRRGMSDQDWKKVSAGAKFTRSIPESAAPWTTDSTGNPFKPKPKPNATYNAVGELKADVWTPDHPEGHYDIFRDNEKIHSVIVSANLVDMVRNLKPTDTKIGILKELRDELDIDTVPAKVLLDRLIVDVAPSKPVDPLQGVVGWANTVLQKP